MSSGAYKKKLQRLADHYKVVQGGKGLREWSDAIKKASKWPGESIEVIYDKTFPTVEPASSTPAASAQVPAKVDGKLDDRGAGQGNVTVLSPAPGLPTHVTVEVAAPNVQVALPSINVDMRQDNLALRVLLSRALQWGQAYALGALTMFALMTLARAQGLSP